MRQYIEISHELYATNTLENYWRRPVFVVRALLHNRHMQELIRFFTADALLNHLPLTRNYAFEQAARHWFYRQSSFWGRIKLIKEHYSLFVSLLKKDALQHIYSGGSIVLWEQDYKGGQLRLEVCFHDCHKKEGLLAIELKLDGERIQQVTFWGGYEAGRETALWIGALQGAPDGRQMNHDLTKFCFGYRPHNLVLYAVRCFARELGFRHMYAVSNYGFYTGNHLRLDRKLKRSLDVFWQEIGGTLTEDRRFFALPLEEPRKDLSEVKSHKRNLYRQRFAMLDCVDAAISEAIAINLMGQ
ncbi:DUF535 family protein [Propionispora vibrioides]|uniref:DUF535 domain-containing protein n=1 Tax=Propionispora vibrioides TaxID=112903 RepID=A0A1H8Q4U3_9FIRM|nr:DUF535 family protein [Propionispora vibrioides]SEO49249.1 hypothetical protein SAMN04490178_102187 [Propionispora vibrioides]